MFEYAETFLAWSPGKNGFQAILVDDQDFAGFNVPLVIRLDKIKGACFRGNNIGAVFQPSQAERAESVGVANRNHRIFGHQEQGIGALDTGKGFLDRLGQAHIQGPGHKVHHNFTVHGGLEDRSLFLEMSTQVQGVDQVAVMSNGQGHPFVVDQKRLGIDDIGFTGCRVADMADGQVAGQALQVGLAEYLGNKPHVLVQKDPVSV